MKTIVITGLDGSGKSTQAKQLQNYLKNAKEVSVWDLIANPAYRDWSIYKFPPNVEKYVINLNPTARTLFVFHVFDFVYKKALETKYDYLIFDSYWYKYLAIELAMGADEKIIDFIKNRYLTPDYCFYLNMPADKLLSRKQQISIYEGGKKDYIDYNNFIKIQTGAKKFLESFLPEKTHVINAELSIKKIFNKVIQIIDQ